MNGHIAPPVAPKTKLAFALPTFGRQGRFAGYVAHELRTPLATQRALLELALADRNADVSDWREVGEDVLRACKEQERLLEACLVLARSELGLQRSDPVDLAVIAANALRAHDLSGLQTFAALEPASTTGDADLIDRLIANLISNAVRHNIAGGRVDVATRTRSGCALLSIANTGPLVPTDELPRLFRPFHRLRSNPRSSGDGVGLGLAIVETIAAAHSARVSAHARPGGGLEIEIIFPLASPKRAIPTVAVPLS
jgi:signal transduction histidine kinase